MSGPSDGPIEPIYGEVGRRVRRARGKAKLTQASLASQTSLSRTSIANIERGEQRMMIHCLFELAAALHVPVVRLLPPEPDAIERTQARIAKLDDQAAATFITSGLQQAKVIK